MVKERRRAERLGSNLFAQLRPVGESESIGRGVVIDVSLSGFGLETETELEIDKTYEFDVEVPITFQAKVVRSISPGQMKKFGVKISGQTFLGKILLRRLLKGKRETVKL